MLKNRLALKIFWRSETAHMQTASLGPNWKMESGEDQIILKLSLFLTQLQNLIKIDPFVHSCFIRVDCSVLLIVCQVQAAD